MDTDTAYLAETLKNIHFEIENKNIRGASKPSKMLADELKTTKLLSVKKFHSNHGKHNNKKVFWC